MLNSRERGVITSRGRTKELCYETFVFEKIKKGAVLFLNLKIIILQRVSRIHDHCNQGFRFFIIIIIFFPTCILHIFIYLFIYFWSRFFKFFSCGGWCLF